MNRLLSYLNRALMFMKANRTAVLFVAALGFGLLAALGIRNYVGSQLAEEKERLAIELQTIEVVVAKRDLAAGETVRPELMAIRELPRDLVPATAIRPEGFEPVIGARLTAPMRRGEALFASLLLDTQANALSAQLKPGVRAMTLSVDEVNSISGMLQPGDRIDLLVSVKPPVSSGESLPEITRTLMQNVRVLATGRQVRASPDEPGGQRSFTAITVEVDPDSAQQLVVAQRSGRLTALLRHADDRRLTRASGLDLHDLLDGTRPHGLSGQATRRAGGSVEMIVGGRGQLAPAGSSNLLPLGTGPAPAISPAAQDPVPGALAVAPRAPVTPVPAASAVPLSPILIR